MNAPLVATKVAIIDAPIDHVWEIQSNIENWPKWQRDISIAKLHGPLEKGTVFTWVAMGMNITSQLQEVVENKIIGWTGKSIGMRAVHIWRFEKKGEKTSIQTEESLSGWFPRLIRIFKPNFLEESLDKSLNTLKIQAETSWQQRL